MKKRKISIYSSISQTFFQLLPKDCVISKCSLPANYTSQQIYFHFLLHEFFQLIQYNFWSLISNLPSVFFACFSFHAIGFLLFLYEWYFVHIFCTFSSNNWSMSGLLHSFIHFSESLSTLAGLLVTASTLKAFSFSNCV